MPQTPPLISVKNACHLLKQGGVIAYPTESSFGLGCDALNAQAVRKIQQLKHRDANKTFIVLIRDEQQALLFIDPNQLALLEKTKSFWPGPNTLLFPVGPSCPEWLQSAKKIALRQSQFNLCQQLTSQYPNPIISTSANLQGQPPMHDSKDVQQNFPTLDGVVAGSPLGLKPTTIRDLLSNTTIR